VDLDGKGDGDQEEDLKTNKVESEQQENENENHCSTEISKTRRFCPCIDWRHWMYSRLSSLNLPCYKNRSM